MLRVSNLSLTKGKAILKDLAFEVKPGEMLAVLGPSGAGKSSLLRCLNRLDPADSGEVYLNGTEVQSLDILELRRRIREADEVIVICGEHTEEAKAVSAELLVAQEEQTPYFLLWGRHDTMCTKPVGAKRDEGIYKWSTEVLQDQITLTLRNARWASKARSGIGAPPKG